MYDPVARRYYRREDALTAIRYINGTRLDDRVIRADWDAGFEEGRQYGRGRSGGQVLPSPSPLPRITFPIYPTTFLWALCGHLVGLAKMWDSKDGAIVLMIGSLLFICFDVCYLYG